MNDAIVEVELDLAIAEGAPDEVDRVTRALRLRLGELPVEYVDLVRGDAVPGGAKSGVDPVTLGALAINTPA